MEALLLRKFSETVSTSVMGAGFAQECRANAQPANAVQPVTAASNPETVKFVMKVGRWRA
jgi:hypothetical protein